ncbi:MAG: hypothetical protein KIT31_06075 [Deltaproteobacteria bacterium]|nr:hypothetical protein [Deltaproteobacteria bacterium]
MFAMRAELIAPRTGLLGLVGAGALIVIGAVAKATRKLDDELVARRIDRASNLADRISTAIAFDRILHAGGKLDPADDPAGEEKMTHEMMVAAIKDGVKAAPRANVRAATPFVAPRDLRAAIGFLAVSALAAGLAVPTNDRTPHFFGATPDHAIPGTEIQLNGDNLLVKIGTPIASAPTGADVSLGAPTPAAPNTSPRAADHGFVPTNARVLLGPTDRSPRALTVLDWNETRIRVVIPPDAAYGDTVISIEMPDGTILGPVNFTVDDPKDVTNFRHNAVVFEPDEKAYIEAIISKLRQLAKKEKIDALEDFANKIEQMMKDAEEGKITKEQLLEMLNKAEEILNANGEPNPDEIKKQLAELGKQLQKNDVTMELGKALEQNNLDKAKEELEELARRLEKSQLEKQMEELKKQLEDKDLTPEQKKALEKKMEELKKQMEKDQKELEKQLENPDLTPEQKKQLEKQMEDLKKELEKKDLTAEQKKQLEKQMEELKKQMENKNLSEQEKKDLQKRIDEMKKEKPLTEQQKQDLQKQLDQVAKQMEKQQKDQEQKQQQAQQKLEEQIRRLQKEKDEAKSEKEKLDAERRLAQKKEELQKLNKENEQKKQSAQREAVKRLQRDVQKAAEQLQKPNKQESRQEQDERERQASQKLKDAARETGKVDQDQRKQASQKKISSQMDDLREAMRRAKQKGNKQGNDPFGKNGKNSDFARRARGQKGNGEAWRPGQGQDGNGQAKNGQKGNGNGNGGKEWGVGTGGPLEGAPTDKSGNTKDVDIEAKSHGKEGGSTRETILSAAQKGFSSTRYQDIYARYQKMVEEVMNNEKLPSSYKYYVKRYFAKIHPSGAVDVPGGQLKAPGP